MGLSVLFALTAAGDLVDDALVGWQAPAECPSIAVARVQIRRAVAGLAIDPAARVRADVAITRESAQRYRLKLALDVGDGAGERVLSAESCAAAVDTAAWLIAIAIDVRAVDPATGAEGSGASPEPPAPGLGARRPDVPAAGSGAIPEPPAPGPGARWPTGTGAIAEPPAPGPGARRPDVPAAGSDTIAELPAPGPGARRPDVPVAGSGTGAGAGVGAGPPDATRTDARTDAVSAGPGSVAPARAGRARRPASTRQLHLDLWLGSGVGVGILPAAAPVAAGGLALSGRRWQIELGGQYWALRRVEFDRGVVGRFVQGHASLRGCAAWELGPVRLSPCAGLALGRLRGEGDGPVITHTAHSLWVGLLVGAQAWLRLHARVRLALQADMVVGLRRPGFTLEPERTVLFRPDPVGFSGLAALVVRLR